MPLSARSRPILPEDLPSLDKTNATMGAAAALGVHVVLPLLIWFLIPLLRDMGLLSAPQPSGEPLQVIEAYIPRLGKELEPNQLPNRDVPRLTTAPQGVAVSAEEPPPDPPEEKEEPPPDAVEDVIQRLGDRAQAFAEIAEEREREGHPEGDPDGVARNAREGDIYAAKLGAFMRNGWAAPTLIQQDELKQLTTQVDVVIEDDGRVGEHRLRQSSGNTMFDQSVINQVSRLEGEDVPEPPEGVRDQYLGRTVSFNFRGRDAD